MTNNITEKQSKRIKLALELGYFEFPRKVHVADLAEIDGGASPPAMNECIRRGIAHIVESYFSHEGGHTLHLSEEQANLMIELIDEFELDDELLKLKGVILKAKHRS